MITCGVDFLLMDVMLCLLLRMEKGNRIVGGLGKRGKMGGEEGAKVVKDIAPLVLSATRCSAEIFPAIAVISGGPQCKISVL